MANDTKMEDSTSAKDEKEKEDVATPTILPLEGAARRLERLLGGGSSSGPERQMYTYGNPVKVTRRWLGTASGASGKATSESIVAAAVALLDPSNADDRTRSLLLAIDTGAAGKKERPRCTGILHGACGGFASVTPRQPRGRNPPSRH